MIKCMEIDIEPVSKLPPEDVLPIGFLQYL